MKYKFKYQYEQSASLFSRELDAQSDIQGIARFADWLGENRKRLATVEMLYQITPPNWFPAGDSSIVMAAIQSFGVTLPAPVNPVNSEPLTQYRFTGKTPHKHAALIKAWADGAVIQYRVLGDGGAKWVDCPGDPRWHETTEYRIKPQNVVRFCTVSHDPRDGTIGIWGGNSEPRTTSPSHLDQFVGNLRVEINPDTMELVSATMVKP